MPRKPKEKDEVLSSTPTKTSKKTTKTSTKTKEPKASTAKKTTKTATTKTKETKASAAKKPTKSTTTKTTEKKTRTKQQPLVEYYDLPYKYNKTVVKILSQTPKKLFIYWEISDEDIENYKKEFGNDFFETTKPYLIINNTTLNYSYEVEINDFANSWYLHVHDSKSNYTVELIRRPINNAKKQKYSITYSNKIESPNDHILFNVDTNNIKFKNVKNNETINKKYASLSFLQRLGNSFNIYDFYKKLYKNEDYLKNISNPSSNMRI